MSADNFDKKPDNSINQDEELTAILQRLSSLLDKSVSLDDAIELAKKQSSVAPLESETVTETAEETLEQDNTEIKPIEDIVELLEQEEDNEEETPVFETEVQETATEEEAVVEEETAVEEENVTEPEETEEDEQPDRSMPVSDFIKLLKTKHFADESEQPEVTEEPGEVTEDTSTDEEVEIVEEKAEVEITPADDETSAKEETQTEKSVFENEAELITEKKPLIEENTDTQETVTEEDTVTSKIFDELLACFDDRKIPDDFRFSDVNTKEETEPEELEKETTEEVSAEEQETEETEQEPTPEFVPIEHENPEEDELFSKIFSEEKSERKNRENDKKKWQNQGNEPSPFLSGLYDWLEVIVLSAAFALLLFTFILRIAIVDGDSMNHTLHDKELLIISDLMYTPENNDIIVFTSPNYPEPIVKRVIATEGQTVDIDFDTWTVTVDGKVIKEDYINRVPGIMNSSDVAFPLTVPEGYVFVMGDNRNESLDSRNSRIGFVDERFILGEVKLRLFPFDRFGTVD